MPAAYPRPFTCPKYQTPEKQRQHPSVSAEGETASQRRSHSRAKVSGREKVAQSETSTRTPSPPYAPCPLTVPVRSSAYGCTRSTKRRLHLAFLCLFPPTAVSNPRGYEFPRHHRFFSPHPHPFQLRLARRPHPPRNSRWHSRCGALPYGRNLQSQPASVAPPVELYFGSVLGRFLRGFSHRGKPCWHERLHLPISPPEYRFAFASICPGSAANAAERL